MKELNHLDLNLLKALNALLEERNVSRAAERLALTQPAVSAMLNRLRHRFNDPLFIRSSHGMLPTNRALALQAPVKQILENISALVKPIEFKPEELKYTFKLAGTENGIRTLGVPFALKISKLAPDVKVAFFPIQGQPLEERLLTGEWDLAILGEQELTENLYYQRLFSETYTCAVRHNHPVLKQEWTVETFCQLEYVLVAYNGGHFAGATDTALERLGKKREVKISVGHFSLLPDLLKQTDYATVAPSHFLRSRNDLALLEPPFVIEGYHKAMAWHARANHDPIQQWFRQIMADVAEEVKNP
ncbi:LysR family transcriptional regulator [Mannheimia bovis]|uniref:LysR family transcriptional regulator n=1 Tax=Mannheimia bovis TaxID=2770636 RepID=UPI0024B7882A|nr:LysR family transcriptional regulator [Mannheimia bovis]WHP47580.1 LysR family transcriptional regulator [Mannheimia bovis]